MSCSRCLAAEAEGRTTCPACGAALAAVTAAAHSSMLPLDGTSTPSGPPNTLLEGAVIADRYRVREPLGRGGMGEVYVAEDLKLAQTVALKILPAELQDDVARRDRLLSEVRLARSISHPNVVRVYDVGEADGQLFLSMERVEGEDLDSRLKRGALAAPDAASIGRQIAFRPGSGARGRCAPSRS